MYNSKYLLKDSSIRQWLPIAVVMVLAIVLRLYQLHTEGVHIDEMLSIKDSEDFQLSFPYNRPVFYMLLNFWMQFGSSDAWLRLMSVGLAMGGIWLTYRLGCRVVGRPTGIIAALLMALSPLFINHAQEIRMYSLIMFLSVAGSLALCHFLERPSYLPLSLWIVARIALLLSNANNVLILFPDTILLAWQYRKQLYWFVVSAMSMGLICLSFLPVALSMTSGGAYGQFMESKIEYSRPGLLLILGELAQITTYWPMGHLLRSNKILLEPTERGDISLLTSVFSTQTFSVLFYAGFTLVLMAVIAVALFSLVADKQRSEKLGWVAAWGLLPFACMVILAYVSDLIWLSRYLLFIAPYILILLATGFVMIWHWKRGLAIGIAIAYFVAVSGGLSTYYTTSYRTEWKKAVEMVNINQRPNDTILLYTVRSIGYDYAFKRYYQGSQPVYHVPNKHEISQFLTNKDSFLVQGKAASLATPDRLWLFCWGNCKKDKTELDQMSRVLLGDSFEIQDQQVFKSLEYVFIDLSLRTPNAAKNSGTPTTEP